MWTPDSRPSALQCLVYWSMKLYCILSKKKKTSSWILICETWWCIHITTIKMHSDKQGCIRTSAFLLVIRSCSVCSNGSNVGYQGALVMRLHQAVSCYRIWDSDHSVHACQLDSAFLHHLRAVWYQEKMVNGATIILNLSLVPLPILSWSSSPSFSPPTPSFSFAPSLKDHYRLLLSLLHHH